MCCTRLAEIQDAKIAKNLPSGHHRTICRAVSSQLRQASTIGKHLLISNISPICPYNMVNFGLVTAEIGLPVWGTTANFNGFRVLASLPGTAATSLNGNQPNFARCLAVSWAGILHNILGGLLSPNGILPGVKFTLSPSCLAILLYWQRHCTVLKWWASAKLCGVQHMAPPIYGRANVTLGIGSHPSIIMF